jgi:ATP adenylyltransferase
MSFPQEHLQNVWAPWRVEYFHQEKEMDFLLKAAQTSDDATHFVVKRSRSAFLILNKYPYTTGHLMVVPYRKVADLKQLNESEVLDLWKLTLEAQQLLKEVVKAQGFNIGINIGEAGGAGVSDHLHLHIVPRWRDDQNFMPLLANTRIIPEGLSPLYEKLRQLVEQNEKS